MRRAAGFPRHRGAAARGPARPSRLRTVGSDRIPARTVPGSSGGWKISQGFLFFPLHNPPSSSPSSRPLRGAEPLPFIVIGGSTGCFSFGVVFVWCGAGFWHPPGARQPSRVGSEVIFPCIPLFYILYMERQ